LVELKTRGAVPRATGGQSLSWSSAVKEDYQFGRCQVANRRMLMGENKLWGLCSRRSTSDVAPCAKCGIASRTMLVGSEVMTAEVEMVVDPAVG
jgi:hypothetical protein